ncbi:hypothetical protein M5D96_002162 [Drosophila gunungcola]|uniref:Uncharacterized protein n=1 Tax=Drosophila gunungcola TaxID=103775 RepID=A0A9P9YZG6_9MUSC|nr:hypothetical protein M5D96_002162 [Drosophila gunungcola]
MKDKHKPETRQSLSVGRVKARFGLDVKRVDFLISRIVVQVIYGPAKLVQPSSRSSHILHFEALDVVAVVVVVVLDSLLGVVIIMAIFGWALSAVRSDGVLMPAEVIAASLGQNQDQSGHYSRSISRLAQAAEEKRVANS